MHYERVKVSRLRFYGPPAILANSIACLWVLIRHGCQTRVIYPLQTLLDQLQITWRCVWARDSSYGPPASRDFVLEERNFVCEDFVLG